MAIEVDTFDLSLRSTVTGQRLTANIYFVDGVTDATGQPRALSIGELVMALCLERAAKLEADIIDLMEKMNVNTVQLEAMTTIEQTIVDWADPLATTARYNLKNKNLPVDTPYESLSYYDFLTTTMGIELTGSKVVVNGQPEGDDMSYDDFITAIESKMDALNSFSQQTMIKLQSQTSKRDQAYDMISNALKSISTVLVGTANNM